MKPVIIGDATLYCGDNRDILPLIGQVDALITDPPYGVELGSGSEKRAGRGLLKAAYNGFADTQDDFSEVAEAIAQSLMLSKRGAVFTSGLSFRLLPPPDAMGGVYVSAAIGRHCWGFNSLAPIALYGKGAGMNSRGCRATVLQSNERADDNGHPCPKPLGWMTWLVDLGSLAGDAILDPFMGSGTTGVAAIQLGRKFIGIERDERYFEIACRRIEQAVAQGQLFAPAPVKQEQEVLF